jgi:hypothetical protein
MVPVSEADEFQRFTTYLNYLRALSLFLKRDFNLSSLREVVASASFMSIQGGRCPDVQRIRQLLRNAWSTEIQLSLAARQEGLVSYSNHWAPVQLYYASYLGLRALLLASNQTVPHDHTATLRAISLAIKARPQLFPQPWRTVCVGEPADPTLGYLNLPSGTT